MALPYTYDQIFAADPANPENVAGGAAITIYAPGDTTMTPLTITTTDGAPLANPIAVNANGFGPAFAHASLDRVAWAGGGFTGFFTSYEGIKRVAVDAQAAAEDAAQSAGAAAGEAANTAMATVVADANSAKDAAAASATSASNAAALVGAPADDAIAAAINGASTQTKAAIKARETIINVLDYGADKTGVNAAHTQIQSAINAASAAGGGTVLFPRGTYSIGASVTLKDNVSLLGSGQGVTTLLARAGLTTAMLLGTSGDSVSNMSITMLTLDGNFTATNLKVRGIQVSAGNSIRVIRTTIQNIGNDGILLQNGTTNCLVEHCVITGTGLFDASGHGIGINIASHRNKIRANFITGGKAMGVFVGTIGAGNASTDTEITGNYISNIEGGLGLECIGVSGECIRTVISGNHCFDSHDNGISITAGESTVTGNIIDGTWRSGIAAGGNNITVTGNRVRNPGQHYPTDGLTWGGISISGTNCTVVGNIVYDDNTTPNMAYGVKEVSPAAGNIIIGNRLRGFRLAEFYRLSTTTLAIVGTRPTIAGSRGGNAALTSLLTALNTAGLVNDTTTA